MELNPSRVEDLGQCLVEEDLLNRHRAQTRQLYETIYGVTPENAEENIDLVFRRVIQERANPLSQESYHGILDAIDLEEIIHKESRDEAFNALINSDQIAQKIANEFLRQAVDVFEIRPEWQSDLEVALDTHVVQALVKTGAIQLDGSDRERDEIGRAHV